MFTPGELKGQLQMTDSVVECGGDQYMTLVIQNHGVEKMRLKKGRCLGTVMPVDILVSGEPSNQENTTNTHADTGEERVETIPALEEGLAEVEEETGNSCCGSGGDQQLTAMVPHEQDSSPIQRLEVLATQPNPRVDKLLSQLSMDHTRLSEEEQQSMMALLAS